MGNDTAVTQVADRASRWKVSLAAHVTFTPDKASGLPAIPELQTGASAQEVVY